MFLVAPALLLFAVSAGTFCATCFLGYFIVIISFGLWIACGIMWIVADALLPRDNGDNKEDNVEGGEQTDIVAVPVDEMQTAEAVAVAY